MTTELTLLPSSSELVRQSTDIASLCKDIVVASSVTIQGRKYVRVEGWQSIATAHGCVASAKDVKRVEGGMVATGEIRRMQDGQLIATAEGFVGEDEPTWYGGRMGSKTLPKRPEYAIRAMAQTRAISRACRGCFAHVVVLMNAGLSTTPAEEVPDGGFRNEPEPEQPELEPTKPVEPVTWMSMTIQHIAELATPNYWLVTLADGKKAGVKDAAIHAELAKAMDIGDPVDLSVIPGAKAGSFVIVGLDTIPM